MSEADGPVSVEAALRASTPHAVTRTLRRLLGERFGATDTVLLLADYGASVLQPVGGGEAVPARTGSPGRAFAAQQAVTRDGPPGTVLAYLPVTVRGDRLGVLAVTLPGPLAAGTLLALEGVAQALAHELPAAERDTDLYVRARRRRRLTLAAEMQWMLLPGRGCARQEYVIGAHLEPAYAIGGDNFDWSAGEDRLTLSVTDGMGEGMPAALLTGLTVAALRNARRSGLSLVDQAALADQAVFAQHGGAAWASSLLLEVDLATGRVEAVDAGSPRLYRLRDGEVHAVPLEAQLPLGMFEETPYTSQTVQLEPGDRLVVVSTGVYSAAAAGGTAYGERVMARRLRASRLAPPAETAHAVVDGLVEHTGSADLEADAAVLCLDWRGRPGG